MSKLDEWFDEYGDLYEGVLLADGFEGAFLGVAERIAAQPVAVYDRAKCIQILELQGMTTEEAEEYFEFNVAGAYVGEQTPWFLNRIGD